MPEDHSKKISDKRFYRTTVKKSQGQFKAGDLVEVLGFGYIQGVGKVQYSGINLFVMNLKHAYDCYLSAKTVYKSLQKLNKQDVIDNSELVYEYISNINQMSVHCVITLEYIANKVLSKKCGKMFSMKNSSGLTIDDLKDCYSLSLRQKVFEKIPELYSITSADLYSVKSRFSDQINLLIDVRNDIVHHTYTPEDGGQRLQESILKKKPLFLLFRKYKEFLESYLKLFGDDFQKYIGDIDFVIERI